jgi:hypothetical protein
LGSSSISGEVGSVSAGGGVDGRVTGISEGVGVERVANMRFMRVLVELCWCSFRICIFSSAMELRVEVFIRFRSFVSVFPNTLKSRSHVAEFAQIDKRWSAKR